jgi:hypothetical protein
MVALRHFRFFTPHSDLLSKLPYNETLDVILHQNTATSGKLIMAVFASVGYVCRGRPWLAHPPSQDISSSIHRSLVNIETDLRVKWQLQSGVSARRDFSGAASKRQAADSVRTRRSSVACTCNCACACVLCVSGNSYLYHHIFMKKRLCV